MYLFIRDEGTQEGNGTPTSIYVLFTGLKQIMKNKQIWVNGLIGCLLYLPLSAFAELWGIPYLKEAHHLSDHQAAFANAMVFCGWAIGGPLIGAISDKIERRRLPLLIAGVLSVISISLLLYFPHVDFLIICALLFSFGFIPSAQALVFPIARESSSTKVTATAIAFTNMLVMLGGMLLQPIIGKLLVQAHGHIILDNIEIYTKADYVFALTILPVSIFVGVILTFFLKETYARVKI